MADEYSLHVDTLLLNRPNQQLHIFVFNFFACVCAGLAVNASRACVHRTVIVRVGYCRCRYQNNMKEIQTYFPSSHMSQQKRQTEAAQQKTKNVKRYETHLSRLFMRCFGRLPECACGVRSLSDACSSPLINLRVFIIFFPHSLS